MRYGLSRKLQTVYIENCVEKNCLENSLEKCLEKKLPIKLSRKNA